MSTGLMKPFVCCTEVNELQSFVKVTFSLFWSNSQLNIMTKLLSRQWNASIKISSQHLSWASVFFSMSKKVMADSSRHRCSMPWFSGFVLKTNKETCFWSKWWVSNICFFLRKQRTMFLYFSTQRKCSSFCLLSFQR